eukprot:830869-Pleurochrysis_carterae.AAC.4
MSSSQFKLFKGPSPEVRTFLLIHNWTTKQSSLWAILSSVQPNDQCLVAMIACAAHRRAPCRPRGRRKVQNAVHMAKRFVKARQTRKCFMKKFAKTFVSPFL